MVVAVVVTATVAVTVAVSRTATGDVTPAAGSPMKPTAKVRAPTPALISAAIACHLCAVP